MRKRPSSGRDFKLRHYPISGANLTFVTQSVTMTSTTPAVLTTPLYRANRCYNSSATDMPAGSKAYIYDSTGVTVTAGVPQTDSKIHMTIDAIENQSEKAATSISSVDYAIVTSIYASVNQKTAAGAVIRFKVRNSGGVFRTVFKRAVNSLGPALEFPLNPPLILPKNCDVLMTAEANATNTPVAAGFNSVLAIIKT